MTLVKSFAFGLVAIFAFTFLVADSAEAAKPAKGAKGGDMFKTLDANSDGKISKEEFDKFGKGKAKNNDKLFAKLDADGNGSLSKDEFAKISELKAAKKKKNNN